MAPFFPSPRFRARRPSVIAALRIHLGAVPSSGKVLEGSSDPIRRSPMRLPACRVWMLAAPLSPWVCFTYFHVPQDSSDLNVLGPVLDGSTRVTSLILAAALWLHFIHGETEAGNIRVSRPVVLVRVILPP